MKKKQLKYWRDSLTQTVLIHFPGLDEKKTVKLRKRIAKNMDKTISSYINLLSKKDRKRLGTANPPEPLLQTPEPDDLKNDLTIPANDSQPE